MSKRVQSPLTIKLTPIDTWETTVLILSSFFFLCIFFLFFFYSYYLDWVAISVKYFSSLNRLSKSKFFYAVTIFTQKHALKIILKRFETGEENNLVKLLQIHTEFPVWRSIVKNLRRFSNILRNNVTAWLQLLKTLSLNSTPLGSRHGL